MSEPELQRSAAPPPPRPGVELLAACAPPDFSRREAGLRERMDGPCTFADWFAASGGLAQVNRWTGAYRPALAFLERVVQARGVGYEPLHIVDVGCGHGDGLRAVAQWAAKRSVPVRLTGVDCNPYAARAARECDRRELVAPKTVEWVTADVFAVGSAVELAAPADVVLSSLFTHHLPDADVVRFLRWCEANAGWGWAVNDLRRSERAYRVFGAVARVMPWHPFLREDGLASFRRAFAREDWERLMGLAGVRAEMRDEAGARICLERLKDNSEREGR